MQVTRNNIYKVKVLVFHLTANKEKDLQKCMTTLLKDNVAMIIAKVKEE
jgi:hypothetical protein